VRAANPQQSLEKHESPKGLWVDAFHLSELVLQRRGLLKDSQTRLPGEGPMDAPPGEKFVEASVAEIYPGLWMTGMSVCASMGGPRMGPIFGGMLLSGSRAAKLVALSLKEKQGPCE
jgi:ribulose 1,5-bisphosphate synthetase/thiazole synthase